MLSELLDQIERLVNQWRGKPVYNPATPPFVPPFNPPVNFCPRCGLSAGGVMGYCCPSPDCPMGLGGVTC